MATVTTDKVSEAHSSQDGARRHVDDDRHEFTIATAIMRSASNMLPAPCRVEALFT
jgi:hypothetical protein